MGCKMTPNTEQETVGVLLVHGIGETKKFENIEDVAKNIAAALLADSSKSSDSFDVKVIINSSDDGEYGSSQQTWLANHDKQGAVVIEIKEPDPNNKNQAKKVTKLVFKEAWWADLGKSDSIPSQLSFWGWGLSLWSRKQFLGKHEQKYDKSVFGTLDQTHLPTTVQDRLPSIKWFDRLRFFVVSWVVLLILTLASLINFVFRRILGRGLPIDILATYLGDIQHYQQAKRQGAGYLIDIGQPMRVSIRRRMIKQLVKMGLGEYDRWYVLAHSLGTVVAFNGLMEPDAALPNYINEDLWEKCQKSPHIKTKSLTKLIKKQADEMFPSRPSWLDLDDIISRKDLFRNLRGFMTYGSPLSKFAVVWPAIVPINNDNSVFLQNFEWINVYDPSDPVADKTKYFDLEKYGGKAPKEIGYKADSFHLFSHIKYLNFNTKRQNPLVKQVANWLWKGKTFQAISNERWRWPTEENIIRLYTGIRYLIWLVFGLLFSWLLSYLASQLLPTSIKNIIPPTNIPNFLLYFVGSAVIVFLFGVLARLLPAVIVFLFGVLARLLPNDN